jgi:hypothetical protein
MQEVCPASKKSTASFYSGITPSSWNLICFHIRFHGTELLQNSLVPYLSYSVSTAEVAYNRMLSSRITSFRYEIPHSNLSPVFFFSSPIGLLSESLRGHDNGVFVIKRYF